MTKPLGYELASISERTFDPLRVLCCYQLDDHLVTDQWATTPVHRDEREQAVLDLVPLARARREVAHTNA